MKAPRFKDLIGVKPELRRLFGDDDEGGVMVGFTATVAFTDTAAKNLFVLPSRSKVIRIDVDVTTAFNSSGTDLLDIGKTGTLNHFKDDLVVSATGQTVTGWSNLGDIGASDVQVTGLYAQSVADSNAGAARITFTCLVPAS